MSHLPRTLFIVIGAVITSALLLTTITREANAQTVLPDKSIRVDGKHFASMSDFHQSAEFRSSNRRCGTVQPSAADRLASFAPSDCSFTMTSIENDYDPTNGEEYVIQTVFHIIERTDGTGTVSDALIQSQIDILNEDFLALAGSPGALGTNGKIRFALATVDPEGKPTTGIEHIVNNGDFDDVDDVVKSKYHWDPAAYFNIYSGEIQPNGILGYATFPSQSVNLDTGEVIATDGVVINFRNIGRNAPMGGIYDQGRTATHEIGHYLGLFHTFQDGCQDGYAGGDLIADTTPEEGPQYGCTVSDSTCAGAGKNPIENYMDYTNDTCMSEFTPEQINRMRCSIVSYRSQLLNALPVADFTFDPSELTIQFTDQSSDADGTVASWAWDFGDGNTSTEPSPSHTYNDFGIYDVTLTVTDNRGVHGIKSEEIVVNIAPTALFEFSNTTDFEIAFTDKSSDQNGMLTKWAWDFGDGSTSAAQSPTHVYLAVGSYNVSLTVTDDLGAPTTYSETITIEEGGCGCASTGSKGTLLGNLGLLGLALLFIRRRKRLIQKNS